MRPQKYWTYWFTPRSRELFTLHASPKIEPTSSWVGVRYLTSSPLYLSRHRSTIFNLHFFIYEDNRNEPCSYSCKTLVNKYKVAQDFEQCMGDAIYSMVRTCVFQRESSLSHAQLLAHFSNTHKRTTMAHSKRSAGKSHFNLLYLLPSNNAVFL